MVAAASVAFRAAQAAKTAEAAQTAEPEELVGAMTAVVESIEQMTTAAIVAVEAAKAAEPEPPPPEPPPPPLLSEVAYPLVSPPPHALLARKAPPAPPPSAALPVLAEVTHASRPIYPPKDPLPPQSLPQPTLSYANVPLARVRELGAFGLRPHRPRRTKGAALLPLPPPTGTLGFARPAVVRVRKPRVAPELPPPPPPPPPPPRTPPSPLPGRNRGGRIPCTVYSAAGNLWFDGAPASIFEAWKMDGVTEPTVFLSCRSPTAEAAGSASVESDERTAQERLQYEASLQYEARLRVAEAQSRVDKLTQREEQIEDQLDELRDQLASFTSERPQTTHGGSDERGGGASADSMVGLAGQWLSPERPSPREGMPPSALERATQRRLASEAREAKRQEKLRSRLAGPNRGQKRDSQAEAREALHALRARERQATRALEVVRSEKLDAMQREVDERRHAAASLTLTASPSASTLSPPAHAA